MSKGQIGRGKNEGHTEGKVHVSEGQIGRGGVSEGQIGRGMV